MEINYFGKPYSFSNIAALRRFGNQKKYISKDTIDDAINSVKTNSIAIVPIENTYGGIITKTVDALTHELYQKNIRILEELEMDISLYVLCTETLKLRKIKKVYSHDYPLKISEPWIKQNLSSADVIRTASTSDAVIKVKKEKYSCAIASIEAARYYGLRSLGEIHCRGKDNITRFFVLGLSSNFQ